MTLARNSFNYIQVSCVKFLMESRDTHNLVASRDAAGLTIMHYAVVRGNPDMIDLLISKVCTYTHTRMHTHTHTHTRTHTHTHTCARTHTHACAHAHTHAQSTNIM